MADQAKGSDEAAQGEQGPEIHLQISTQYVKDLSFENPNAPLIYAELQERPTLDVQIDVGARQLQDRLHEVALMMRVEAKVKDKVAFIVELEYAGLVILGSNVGQEDAQTLLLIEAPRYLFPFARALISNTTRDGGFPPLLINPVDFADLRQRRQQAAEAAKEKAAEAAPAKAEAEAEAVVEADA